MGLIDWIKAKTENRADVSELDTDTVGADILRAVLTGEIITRQQALEIPSVSSSIEKIAGTIASLPIRLYKEKEDGIIEIKNDDRLFLLNHDTKDTLTATQFWKAMIEDYFLGVGAYAFINKEFSDIKSIHYIENDYIGFMQNCDPIFKHYTVCVNGIEHDSYEFLKLLRHTKDGHKSKPLQEENLTEFQIAYATMIYEKNLLAKGGNKKGFLTSEKTLSQAAIDSIKDAYRNLYSNNSDNVVVLNSGMDFKESSNSCVEMQLNENKESNSDSIRDLFGLGKNDEEYVSNCIIPLINTIEDSLDRDLLTEKEKEEKYYFAFDTKELKRGNIRDRYEAYQIAYKNNFLQVDEIREMEDLKPLGFDFIRLGLDSVLYNPKTQEVYTPNTNKTAKMDMLQKGEADES